MPTTPASKVGQILGSIPATTDVAWGEAQCPVQYKHNHVQACTCKPHTSSGHVKTPSFLSIGGVHLNDGDGTTQACRVALLKTRTKGYLWSMHTYKHTQKTRFLSKANAIPKSSQLGRRAHVYPLPKLFSDERSHDSKDGRYDPASINDWHGLVLEWVCGARVCVCVCVCVER